MLDMPTPPGTTGDYVTVKRAIEFISKRYRDQPSIEAIASHVGLSASHFQHVFKRWAGLTPKARLVEDARLPAPYASRAFDPALWRSDAPLRIVLIGTDFELRVWETLLSVPMGRATTYSDIACKIGKPTAARAVGAAVGKNPISFVVPCHRVLGRSGALTGYHWGLARKQAIIGWEAGRIGSGA